MSLRDTLIPTGVGVTSNEGKKDALPPAVANLAIPHLFLSHTFAVGVQRSAYNCQVVLSAIRRSFLPTTKRYVFCYLTRGSMLWAHYKSACGAVLSFVSVRYRWDPLWTLG